MLNSGVLFSSLTLPPYAGIIRIRCSHEFEAVKWKGKAPRGILITYNL